MNPSRLQAAGPPIWFDLTEQFLTSGLRAKYYGIVRTVMEVGLELGLMARAGEADIRFAVFSPGHGTFFEVTPRLGPESATGVIDAAIPHRARPLRIRESYASRNVLRDGALSALRAVVALRNRRAWARNPPAGARAVDLHGEVLVTMGRPKIVNDYMTALARRGVRPRLHVFVHDMIPLHMAVPDGREAGAGLDAGSALRGGGGFARNFLHDNRRVIGMAEHVLANSAFTARDVAHLAGHGVLPEPARMTAVPLCHEMRATDEAPGEPPPPPGYLLSVGILLGRKNLECVMAALMHLHGTGREVPRYVIAGAARDRVAAYVDEARFAPVRDRISFRVSPGQEELRALYGAALALVIPSRMEGWGLPLGEALWCGTPAIAASAPALDEVGGDLALWHDPDAPEALADHVARLMEDAPWRAALRARIRAAKGDLRTWRMVASEIVAAVGGGRQD